MKNRGFLSGLAFWILIGAIILLIITILSNYDIGCILECLDGCKG